MLPQQRYQGRYPLFIDQNQQIDVLVTATAQNTLGGFQAVNGDGELQWKFAPVPMATMSAGGMGGSCSAAGPCATGGTCAAGSAGAGSCSAAGAGTTAAPAAAAKK